LSGFDLTSSSTDNPSPDLQLRDYLDILWRRKLWILLTTLGVFVMGVVVATRLPSIYHSETVIVVDPQKVPESIVPSTAPNVLERLSTIRQLVLSPTRLTELAQKLNLHPGARDRHDLEVLVAGMQQSITIEVSDSGYQRLSAFKIGYTSRSPRQAALVANELANMVIQEGLKAREIYLYGTEEFLDNELQNTKKELEKKEAEVGAIRTKYIQDIPESKQFHIEALESLRSQLRASQDRVSRDQTEKTYVQSMLLNSNPVIDIDANNGEGASSPTQLQIDKLEMSLAQLRSRYGPGYPDVRKLESELHALRAKKAQEDANTPKRDLSLEAATRAAKNPVVASQLAKLEQDVNEQNKLQAQLNEQINFHVLKLEQAPIFESQIAGLMRDYEALRTHYNALLDRKISAGMATNLESHQKAEHFQVLDVAPIPDKPSAPNRPLIALGALLGGLFAGLGLALVVDMSDMAVRSEKEAARILGVPALAGIPAIVSPQEWWAQNIRLAVGVVAIILVSAGAGLLITIFSSRIG
jgi:polysaccharide chain length determinant protein (PEP-CTERM system associated)